MPLETILHTLATRPGRVSVRLSTIQERATAKLNALRPDLPLRKQITHWAAQHQVVACFEDDMVTFEKPTAVPPPCPECAGLGGRYIGDPCHGTEGWQPCSCTP